MNTISNSNFGYKFALPLTEIRFEVFFDDWWQLLLFSVVMRTKLTITLSALWLLCLLESGYAKYTVPDLDNDFQESIAEIISNDVELDKDSQIDQLRKVLKRLVGIPETPIPTADSLQQTDVSMDGSIEKEVPKTPCHKHFGCEECVSNLCAWCIAQRVCKDDAAWQCLGQHDHVGLGGVGDHMRCPSIESMNQQRQARRKRKEEAKKENTISDADKASSKGASKNSTESEGNDTGSVQQSREEKLGELKRRAALAADNYGASHPYETLGVDITASGGEIRKVYRKLSLLYHPDKNQGDEEVAALADAAFKDIVAAFDILGGIVVISIIILFRFISFFEYRSC